MTTLFPSQDEAGAIFSRCRKWRYHLWRRWDETLPTMVFVMQNPSVANETELDNTIRRCIGFAKRDDFGSVSIRNVFSYVATDERELLAVANPVGPENEQYLLSARNVSLMTRLVVAWGNRMTGKRFKTAYDNAAAICQGQRAYCLGTTRSGEPRHPLYVRADEPLILWKGA